METEVPVDVTDPLVVVLSYLILVGARRLGLFGSEERPASPAWRYAVPGLALVVAAVVRAAFDLAQAGELSWSTLMRAVASWGVTIGQHALRREAEKYLEAVRPPAGQ